jgi:hypothetical protein
MHIHISLRSTFTSTVVCKANVGQRELIVQGQDVVAFLDNYMYIHQLIQISEVKSIEIRPFN